MGSSPPSRVAWWIPDEVGKEGQGEEEEEEGWWRGCKKKKVSGTMALMVLDSVNNTAALRRPGHRLPKQDGRLRLGGLRFQRETTARPGLCRHDARHSREALLETIRFTQLLSRCALLCFCAEHHAKEGKINWKKKPRTDGLHMMKTWGTLHEFQPISRWN